jgi:Phage integrase, N-terminal SAM-like domain
MRWYVARSVLGVDLDLTLTDYLDQWLKDGDWRPNTYRLRKLAIDRHIVPHIGLRRVADLDVDDVKLLFRKLKELEVGTATRKQVHVTLNSALNVLYRERRSSSTLVPLLPRRATSRKRRSSSIATS